MITCGLEAPSNKTLCFCLYSSYLMVVPLLERRRVELVLQDAVLLLVLIVLDGGAPSVTQEEAPTEGVR